MNRKTQASFNQIQAAVAAFQSNVQAALSRYRQEEAQARADAEQFKDSEGRYVAQKAALVANARNAITRAQASLKSAVQPEIEALRKELHEHTMNRPAPALLDTLRTFRDFNLQPSRTDLDSMLEIAAGNTLALRAINSVLEATKSPLHVDFPDTGTFEKDLDALEKLTAESAWTPTDYHHEACTLYGGQPRANRPGYIWDSTSLIVARSAFESQLNAILEMSKRWTDDVIPSITQVKTGLYADNESGSVAEQYLADREATGAGAKVEPSQAAAIEAARTMGQKRAEADNNAREALGHYGVKE